MRPLTYSNIFVLRWFKSWSWKRTLAKFEGWQVSFFFSKLFSHRFLLKCGNFKLSSKSHPACVQITDCMKPVRWVFFFGKFSEVSWRDIQNYYRAHKFNSFNGRLSLLGWVIQSMPIQPTIHENNARTPDTGPYKVTYATRRQIIHGPLYATNYSKSKALPPKFKLLFPALQWIKINLSSFRTADLVCFCG